MAASDFGRQAQCSRGSVDKSANYILQPWTFRHIGQCARAHVVPRAVRCTHGVVSSANSGFVTYTNVLASMPWAYTEMRHIECVQNDTLFFSTSGVLDYALNLSISLSAGKETKWDSHSNGE